jgi:2-phosphoglycerate kinase
MSVAESRQPPVLVIVGVSGRGKSTVAGEIFSRLRLMPVSALAQRDEPARDVAYARTTPPSQSTPSTSGSSNQRPPDPR